MRDDAHDETRRRWTTEVTRRLAELRLSPEDEAAVADELAEHLEDRYGELRAGGFDDAQARQTAIGELDEDDGLAARLAGVVRNGAPARPVLGSGNRGGFLTHIAQDAKYAARAMRRSPGFTTTAVVTLALGIGAATTIFGVTKGVLLSPLPYRAPHELVTFWGTAPEKGLPVVDFPSGLFVVIRNNSRAFAAMAAFENEGFTVTGVGEPVRVDAAEVSTDFFRVFGTAPVLGRTFLPDDASPDAYRVTVISHAFWQRQFGGDSGVVGRPIKLNGNPSTIVGVMPPEFAMRDGTLLWVPHRLDPARFDCWCLSMVGRLKPGVSVASARSDLIKAVDDFAVSRPDVFPDAKPGNTRIIATPLVRHLVGDVWTPILVLLTAVGVLLLIACANIANLLLARATARTREMAVRCCLGASPRRIATQLLTESGMIAAAGAVIGLALAVAAVRLVRRLPTSEFPRIDQVRVDPMVVFFAVGVTTLCALLFGLTPAIRASRVDLQTHLNDGARSSASGRIRRVSDAFVVVQVALSLVLLAGAGLLGRSFQRLLAVDPGFRAENVLVARLQPPYARYDSATVVRRFYGRVLERAAALPGVRGVGLTMRAPFTRGNPQDNVIAEGHEPKPGEPVLVANTRYVTPGYFDAIGTPILQGRGFTEADDESTLRVAVVDETLARRYWPKGDAVGKRIQHQGDTTAEPWMTIIGVVPNVRHASLGEEPSLQVYEAFAQRTPWTMYLVVRATSDPEALLPALRGQVAAVDPEIPLYDVRTMEHAVSRSLVTRRLTNVLLGSFATAAFVLAAIGIYGVISIGVAARTREFGVRIALGARSVDVSALVLRRGVWLAGTGIAIGLVGATWAVRFLRGLLFGVSAFDVPTFTIATGALAAVALIACFIPARRATQADPLAALRAE